MTYTIPVTAGEQIVNVVFYEPIVAKELFFETKQGTPIVIDLNRGITGGNPLNQVNFTITTEPQHGVLQ